VLRYKNNIITVNGLWHTFRMYKPRVLLLQFEISLGVLRVLCSTLRGVAIYVRNYILTSTDEACSG